MSSRYLALLFVLLSSAGFAAEPFKCRVDARFNRHGSIAQAVTEAIRQSDEQVLLALYGFNNEALADELLRIAQRGVSVRLKIDSAKADERKTVRLVRRLKAGGIRVSNVAADGRNHNKFAVIDGIRVLTGSYNWTRKAESNWENLLILDCAGLAREYEKEWEKLR